ncbi:unnamed protein product [Staurois parvus]|uniref:Uncharacterized protein n=1 Tax=Staurois parvus TaxID=386267 RepID=A0ABN9AMJ2_9NEOB|nr:unnamed protein product [Staurois parvus]
MAREEQCRDRWAFINVLPACARSLVIAVRDLLCEVPNHMVTDWPISDHMNNIKQDVTSDIIAYY